MPLRSGRGTADIPFHVMNRGARRLELFETPADYRAFLFCLAESLEKIPVRLVAYCLMPNHFHLVAVPVEDGQLSVFMKHLLSTHAQRWRAFRHTTGNGAVYQGRFRAFPIQADVHFFTVCRYVERNALRAGLVARAEAWPWSSLAQTMGLHDIVPLSEWPLPRPVDWLETVNGEESGQDLQALRRTAIRESPFGAPTWAAAVAKTLGTTQTLRPRGRPRRKTVGRLFS